MKELVVHPQFVRDLRALRIKLRSLRFDDETLEYVIELLLEGALLPEVFRLHNLQKRETNLSGWLECHLDFDVLVQLRIFEDEVVLFRVGTHQALFSVRRASRLPDKEKIRTARLEKQRRKWRGIQ